MEVVMRTFKNTLKLAVVAVLPLVAAVAVMTLVRAQEHLNDTRVLSLPSQWVPFCAKVMVKTAHDEQPGVYCRRKDGSTVSIIETSRGPVTTISNTTDKRTYAAFPGTGWVHYGVAPSALAPPRSQIALPVRRSSKIEGEQVAGGDVYELRTSRGTVTRYATAINGFAIYSRQANGVGIEYYDILLGDPPDSMFVPPAGKQVRERKAADLLPPAVAKRYVEKKQP
jgi:hypothetical protein